MTLIMALSLFSTLAIGMMPAYLSAKPQKLPSDGSIVFSGKGDWFGHPKYYLGRTSTHGRQHLAWFRGGLATRFWVKGCLDPESDGASIRSTADPFYRNRYDVAQGIQSGPAASYYPVRWHHWLLLCGVSVFPTSSSYASEQ